MKLILGLGNVGDKYKNTYHNVGFMAVDYVLQSLELVADKQKFNCIYNESYFKGERLVIAKPTTFMNLSGQALEGLCCAYHFKVEDMLVVYDDVDLALGALRLRSGGSSGTHNGMRNIYQHINGQNLKRLRVGVGRPVGQMELSDYVLSAPTGDESTILTDTLKTASLAVLDFINDVPFEQIMQNYNKK